MKACKDNRERLQTEKKFRFDIRNKFFTVRVVSHQNKLHKTVNVPSLGVLMARLDGAPSSLA